MAHKKSMKSELKQYPVDAKKIGQEVLLRVSARGEGLYLFLPKDVAEVYGILPGDRIKTNLMIRFRVNAAREAAREIVMPILQTVDPKLRKKTE